MKAPFFAARNFIRSVVVLSAFVILFGCSSLFDSGDGSSTSSSAPSLELSYGTAIVSSGGTVNAGGVLIGNYKDFTLAIRNKGSKFLVLSGTPAVAIEGTDASQFVLRTSSFPTILKVGEYLAFKVRFTPTSLGTKSASLKISSTDGTSSEFKMTVSCLSYKIPVTSIGLSPTALPLMVGETGLLTATVTPSNATYSSVTWASADPAIATVSDTGLVTGIAVGSTTITATTDAGDYSAAYPVSVYTPYTPTSWTEVSASATSPIPVRRYHQTVALGDYIYFIGGDDSGGSSYNKNDVYRSSDAVNWECILPDTGTPGPSQFSRRRCHACVVFQNKIWLVGGWLESGAKLNDVWSSSDGIYWTKVLADTSSPGSAQFSERMSFGLVTDGEKLYVIGGSDASDTALNDVWSSSDGVTWTKDLAYSATETTTQFAGRGAFGCAYLNGNFYVYSGSASSYCNDVWSSADKGKTWTKIASSFPTQGRIFVGAAAYGGKLWLAGGYYNYGTLTPMNDLYSSPDGVTWTTVLADTASPSSTQFTRRYGATLTAFKDKLYLLGGATGSALQDVWQVQ